MTQVECDICGQRPAKGNIVYESSGHRPLCMACNVGSGALGSASEMQVEIVRLRAENQELRGELAATRIEKDRARAYLRSDEWAVSTDAARALADEPREDP